jgi:hypothetical protein
LYRMGSRTVELIETVTERNLPDTFAGTYTTKGVFNIVRNSFLDQGGQTRWLCETEFRFSGLMRLLSWLMPGLFRKQTMKFMQQFKTFAESQRA